MMTNGPNAQIGEIMDIGFARPRDRSAIMSSSQYVEMRNSALDFLYNRYAHSEDWWSLAHEFALADFIAWAKNALK